MELLTSVTRLKHLLGQYSNKEILTNNYIFPDTYDALVNSKKLTFVEKNDNLVLLVDKEDFYQLFYHLNNLAEPFHLNPDKAVMMEIIYRGDNNKPLNIIDYWEKSGFILHIIRDQMSGMYSSLSLPSENLNGVVIRYAQSVDEGEFVRDLIKQTFDKYSGDILTLDEIMNFITNRNILCAYFDNQLCGFLQFEIKNNVVWIGHIAVASNFRGKGIAKELVRSYIKDNAIKPNTRFQLWVMQQNSGAIDLYRKFGFVYANKSSASMLKLI